MQRVLIGCSPKTALVRVRAGLEDLGHEVDAIEEMGAILEAAGLGGLDLLIVGDVLQGGTGIEVCATLGDAPGHPPILYVGDLLVPGADAVAPPEDEYKVLERAVALLEGNVLADSLADMQAEATETQKRAADWEVAAGKPMDAIRKADAPAANGAGTLTFEALLRRVRECDYFEILGIGVEATRDEVRAAYARLKERAKALAKESSVPRSHLDEVQSALDEARDVLSEPSLREAYARNRP